jgi:hypothetical protein
MCYGKLKTKALRKLGELHFSFTFLLSTLLAILVIAPAKTPLCTSFFYTYHTYIIERVVETSQTFLQDVHNDLPADVAGVWPSPSVSGVSAISL